MSDFDRRGLYGKIPKTYDHTQVEERLYAWWEKSGYFKPEIRPDGKPFVIAIPPPNVTGELHLGHPMFVALEDLMIRHARMQGRAALWVPGTDHAGIATQLQVEKHLMRTEEVTRHDLGREEFERRVWAWKEKYGSYITRQLRRLGASCDWDRERFTLDEGLSRAVIEAFVRLWEMGLIYRGDYLINWSPGLQTAVSDLEVEYFEEEGRLYYFKYMLADAKDPEDYIPVATTRPETILGDTAVAVHPEDERYQHWIGRECIVPMLNRRIPVIADAYVDREFGTGALKITPGHDPNDFEIGRRHNLPIINVMNPDATMSEAAGPYAGLDRFACREKLWADMAEAGLTLKTERHVMPVPRSQRGGEVVEPMVSTQWFVRMRPLAELGLEAVRSGRIKIVPERFERVYSNWLENIRDWCISRQLWWGHRIPAWYGPDDHIFVARTEADARAQAEEHYGKGSHADGRDVELRQEEDVLDTWFSSALWPFSTLGWPEDTPDFRRYYPTHVMETGYDILFFWVARMIMTGLLFTNKPPFHIVYLHGLVRDEQGRKMSKTLGNVVDPLDIMNELGTDALRFTLLTGSTPGNDMNLSLDRVRANRNFTNKIWNAMRFVVGVVGDDEIDTSAPAALASLALPERWLLSRLNSLIATVNRLFANYQFGEAGRQIYDFFWGDYCDWYLEIAKVSLAEEDAAAQARIRGVLVHVLDYTLRLLHPFIPFVTEEAWQKIPHAGETLMLADWPQAGPVDEEALRTFERLRDLVRTLRNARAEYNVEPGRRIPALLVSDTFYGVLQEQSAVIAFLARLDASALEIKPEAEAPQNAVTLVAGGITAYLPLAGMVDLAAEEARLDKALKELGGQLQRTRALLSNDGFRQKAPAAVVKREEDKLADLERQAQQLRERLASLTLAS